MSRFGSHRLQLIAAFAAVYLIWGSTYLAIRVGIESLPPFVMAGFRFLLAGAILLAWERHRGTPLPTRSEWRNAALVGGLLLVGGNGIVTWAELRVPSGLAAVLVAAVPICVVVLDRVFFGGPRLTARVGAGLVLGMAGVVMLVKPDAEGVRAVDPIGAVAILLAALFWALGSLRSRGGGLPPAPSMSTAAQMLAGGALNVFAGTLLGEWARLDVAAIGGRSVIAFGYLVTLGSIVAFRAYIWLLRATRPAAVATYAFVNPVVALVLGWALGHEHLTANAMLASGLIVAAVLALQLTRAATLPHRRRRPVPAATPPVVAMPPHDGRPAEDVPHRASPSVSATEVAAAYRINLASDTSRCPPASTTTE